MEKNKCTVVIPTYNRPAHLKRILSYYHQYGCGLPLIIADSSSVESKRINQETVSSFHDAPFTYLDRYDPSTNPYYKFLQALLYVNTEYCVFCADDDFITPHGILESCDFLDINTDYTAAHGKLEYLLLESDRGDGPQFCYVKHHSPSNTNREGNKRLIHELANYEGVSFYAVRHTDFMRLLFTEVLKSTSGHLFSELLVPGLTAIYGKIKCLDTLFWVREICTPASLINTREHPGLQEIINNKNFQENKQTFSDFMADHLSKQSGIDKEESYKIVDKALSLHMKHYSAPIHKINRMLTDLKLPFWLDHGIRKLYRSTSLLFSPSDSAYCRTAKYDEDLDQIRRCVLANAKEVYGLNP